MEWTREQRYRKLEDASSEEMMELQSKVNQSPWRQAFHIQPNTGLLNDPNAFSYFNGEYHLFYQWFPLGPVHGLKYWYHLKSKNLVDWEDAGVGIEPGSYFDSHGAYSGSAIEHEGKLYLMYTGNTRDQNWERHPFQAMAVMNAAGTITKLKDAVISEVPKGYTDHFRDPKVWKDGDTFYAVLGAQRTDETGCVVLFSSPNLLDWTFEGEIETHLPDFGFMWECPDYFVLQDTGVLIFSPQGIEPQGDHYQNIYQSGYLLGNKLNLPEKGFEHNEFIELDRGFDFYAPQTTTDASGRRLLVGWMGLPEISYPTDAHGWAHCLTIPRELSVHDGKIVQKPATELVTLRKEESRIEDSITNSVAQYPGFNGTVYEMIVEFDRKDATEFGIEFRAGSNEKTVLSYHSIEKKVILDRTESGQPFGTSYGTVRKCALEADKIKFHLFVDVSSVEVFVNNGEEVFTSRIFPSKESNEIRFFAKGGTTSFRAVKWDITNKEV